VASTKSDPKRQMMKQLLLKWTTKIFSDVHNAIVALIVASIFVAVGGLLWTFAKSLILFLPEFLQSQMPIWAATLLGLLSLLYTYVKTRNPRPLPNPPITESIRKPISRFFDVGHFRWKARIHSKDYIEVEETPWCIKHDLQLVSPINHYGATYYCPKRDTKECGGEVSAGNLVDYHSEAESIIEKEVRNDPTLN
jgi:hypothetical protein